MSRLIDEINKYKEAFKEKVPQEFQEVMLQKTEELKGTNLSKNALGLGSTAKDFALFNAINQTVSLDDLLMCLFLSSEIFQQLPNMFFWWFFREAFYLDVPEL